MMKSVKLWVSGRVQGVFYRASAEREAKRLGIVGFVRNEPDGSVYIEAEGEERALENFIGWCRRGPDRARVDQIKKEEQPVRSFLQFEVRR